MTAPRALNVIHKACLLTPPIFRRVDHLVLSWRLLLTKCLEQDCYWEDSILWQWTFHYHIHVSSQLAPILSYINPVHDIYSYLFKINCNSNFPPTSRPCKLLCPSGYTAKTLHAFLFSPVLSTSPTVCLPFIDHLKIQYLMNSQNNASHHYEIFSSLLLLCTT